MIFISPSRGDPVSAVPKAHVVPGMGIEGDRFYHLAMAGDEKFRQPDRQLTLIEMEAIEAMNEADGISLTPNQTRRNIITRGISLNSLVNHDFHIGRLMFHGVRLCEPCDYLANRTDPRLKQSMANRGGLRAQILTDGYIYLDDIISPFMQGE